MKRYMNGQSYKTNPYKEKSNVLNSKNAYLSSSYEHGIQKKHLSKPSLHKSKYFLSPNTRDVHVAGKTL